MKGSAGAAYLYRKPAGGWVNLTQTQELNANDFATNAEFGDAVAITGSTVAAAAPTGDGASTSSATRRCRSLPARSPTPRVGRLTALRSPGPGDPPDRVDGDGLPAGLSINATSGAISGTPTTAGSATPTFTVTDSLRTER